MKVKNDKRIERRIVVATVMTVLALYALIIASQLL
jgi:hypothetical protein